MTNYTSSQLVESAGAILFCLRKRAICLIHLKSRDQWLLPKGRRALGESRKATALRESTEETGYKCHLLPVTMLSRVTPEVETEQTPDTPRLYENISEPFSYTIRTLRGGRTKFISWYIAAIDENESVGVGEKRFDATLFGYEEAVEKLTFEDDKKVLEQAIGIVESTYRKSNAHQEVKEQ